MKKTETRGGARTGSGRKAVDYMERKHPITIYVERKYIVGEDRMLTNDTMALIGDAMKRKKTILENSLIK